MYSHWLYASLMQVNTQHSVRSMGGSGGGGGWGCARGGGARASNSSSPHQNIVVRHDVGQRTRPIGFISQYDLILIVEGHVSLALLVEDV